MRAASMADVWSATNDHLLYLGDLFWKQAGVTFYGCLASGFAGNKASSASAFLAAEVVTAGYARAVAKVSGAVIGPSFATAFDASQDRGETPIITFTIQAGENAITYDCFFILLSPADRIVLFYKLSTPDTIQANRSRDFLIYYNLGGGNAADVDAA